MRRRLFGVVAAIVVVPVVVGWWLYPANRIMRTLRAVDLPDGYRVTHTKRAHGALCFDSCPDGTRWWVTDSSPEAAADAVTKALAEDGWRVTLAPCVASLVCTHPQDEPYQVETMTAAGHAARQDYAVSVTVGRRDDGRTGIMVTVSGGI
jgi:hypothetical protein